MILQPIFSEECQFSACVTIFPHFLTDPVCQLHRSSLVHMRLYLPESALDLEGRGLANESPSDTKHLQTISGAPACSSVCRPYDVLQYCGGTELLPFPESAGAAAVAGILIILVDMMWLCGLCVCQSGSEYLLLLRTARVQCTYLHRIHQHLSPLLLLLTKSFPGEVSVAERRFASTAQPVVQFPG